MIYDALADLVVLGHFAFILFAMFGALLVLWRQRIIWLHVPALLWGTTTELLGIVCPLTYLENYLRRQGQSSEYAVGFIEQYLVPIIYPTELTREIQWLLGALLVVLNLLLYAYVWRATRLARSVPHNVPLRSER